jgi:hypothetical protein
MSNKTHLRQTMLDLPKGACGLLNRPMRNTWSVRRAAEMNPVKAMRRRGPSTMPLWRRRSNAPFTIIRRPWKSYVRSISVPGIRWRQAPWFASTGVGS